MNTNYILAIIFIITGLCFMIDQYSIAKNQCEGCNVVYDAGFIMFIPSLILLVINGSWDICSRRKIPDRREVE